MKTREFSYEDSLNICPKITGPILKALGLKKLKSHNIIDKMVKIKKKIGLPFEAMVNSIMANPKIKVLRLNQLSLRHQDPKNLSLIGSEFYCVHDL